MNLVNVIRKIIKTQKKGRCFLKSSIMVNYNTSVTYIVSAVPK